jgi:hypothetical protein
MRNYPKAAVPGVSVRSKQNNDFWFSETPWIKKKKRYDSRDSADFAHSYNSL